MNALLTHALLDRFVHYLFKKTKKSKMTERRYMKKTRIAVFGILLCLSIVTFGSFMSVNAMHRDS